MYPNVNKGSVLNSLAIGSTESLAARYALYEVHFPARTREDITKAQQLMARIPGSRIADDVATRFEVPIRTEDSAGEPSRASLSLAQLFDVLSTQDDVTVERMSLESVFLKVIREHHIQEENSAVERRRGNRRFWSC